MAVETFAWHRSADLLAGRVARPRQRTDAKRRLPYSVGFNKVACESSALGTHFWLDTPSQTMWTPKPSSNRSRHVCEGAFKGAQQVFQVCELRVVLKWQEGGIGESAGLANQYHLPKRVSHGGPFGSETGAVWAAHSVPKQEEQNRHLKNTRQARR